MMEILIYHERQTGDVIMGAHCAKLLKKKYPGSNIIFVTQEDIVPVIESCDWIDLVLPTPVYPKAKMFTKEEMKQYVYEWEFDDLVDIRRFNIMRDEWKPDLAFKPRWNFLERPVPYKAPYMFRCYAHCCDLTQEEANDTAYEVPVSEEEREEAKAIWKKHQGGKWGLNVVLHMHYLDSSFAKLQESYNALILDTSGAKPKTRTKLSATWRQNLAIIAEADVVVTRYGGVAVMAAATGTPTIQIPKPEPTMWASPVYSHPNQGHVMLLPESRCPAYEGTDEHRSQPCVPEWGKYKQELCPLGHPHRDLRERGMPDSYHCWRQITVEEVERVLDQKELEPLARASEEALAQWWKENPYESDT
jgi:hypothetical protein